MKKYYKHMLLAFICLTAGNLADANAQNAFYDARKLALLKNSHDLKPDDAGVKDEIYTILLSYVNNRSTTGTLAGLKKAYENERFMSAFLNSVPPAYFDDIKLIESVLSSKNFPKQPEEIQVKEKLLRDFEFIREGTSDLNNYNKIFNLEKMLPDATTHPFNDEKVQLLKKYYQTYFAEDAETVIKAADSLADYQPVFLALKHRLSGRIAEQIKERHDEILSRFNSNRHLRSLVALKGGTYSTSIQNQVLTSLKTVETNTATRISIEQLTSAKMSIPSQSEMIDAMAVYLANRVKLETTLTFLDQIKKNLREDRVILELFPRTTALLSSYSSYEMPRFGAAWRHAFAEDFVSIPEQISGKSAAGNYLVNRLGGSDNAQFRFFMDAVEFASLSRQNNSFTDIIEYFNQQYGSEQQGDFLKYTRFISMLNKEFYSTGERTYWISFQEFNKLSENEMLIMAALLKQKYPDVFNDLNVDINRTATIDGVASVNDLKRWLSGLFFTINQFQIAQQNIDKVGNSSGNYWRFVNSLYRNAVEPVNKIRIFKTEEKAEKFMALYQAVFEFYTAIDEKNYTHGLEQMLVFFKTLQPEAMKMAEKNRLFFLTDLYKENEASDKVKEIIKHTSALLSLLEERKDPSVNKTEVDSVIAKHKKSLIEKMTDTTGKSAASPIFSKNFKKNTSEYLASLIDHYDFHNRHYEHVTYGRLVKVVSFINDVINTNDSKDLSNVIASYASPPQSYRLKRNSRTSMMFNAYVGVRAGYESGVEGTFAYGLTAPIGISLNWGHLKAVDANRYRSQTRSRSGIVKDLTGSSSSLVINLVDIGAVVSYRLGSTAEGLPEKVRFTQIISPSVQYHRGLKNLPLSLFAGVQYLPELRSFADKVTPASVYQINGGVVFDLPLFTIWDSNGR